MKTGMICLAALAFVGASANASPVAAPSAPSVHVSFADLDLTSSEGRATFDRRIRSAAETLCSVEGDRTLDSALGAHACFKAAVASGRQQMDQISQRLAAREAGTKAGH